MYFYVKALHIIFVVTWFAGLFYIVRLFIYNREACDKPESERIILQQQFGIMIQRLWLGITWPSCVLTLIFGSWMLVLYGSIPVWLMLKLVLVAALLLYHASIHVIYLQQRRNIFAYSSNALRIWNEVATLFLVAIVMLVSVKEGMSLVWGLTGLIVFALFLVLAIRIYRRFRRQ
ncbi:MAG: CopD family protein [Bacteroidetes bacterium]|nr:CopD family protein [Bacteroidota bacterium]